MYYGGISGRGVGKILGINKSNVMNWIKKGQSDEAWRKIHNRPKNCGIGRVILVSGAQILDWNPRKYLHHDHGEPKATANRGTCGKPEQIIQDNPEDGWRCSWGRSRCFPRKLENLQAVLAVFVQAYNRFGLQKHRHRSLHPGAAVPFSLFDFF